MRMETGRGEWKEGGQKGELGHQYVCICACFCVHTVCQLLCSNVTGMLWGLRFCGERWEKNSLVFCRKLLTELCSVDLQ